MLVDGQYDRQSDAVFAALKQISVDPIPALRVDIKTAIGFVGPCGQKDGKAPMSKLPNLYDLYAPTSLLNLERSISEGKIPTGSELAAVMEANSETPLPPWFTAIVIKSLRGELKRRKGRPKASFLSEICFTIAKGKYPLYLAWLQKRERSYGLEGWSAVRGKDWWAGPPHERAARIVTARWLKHMSWRAFLNRPSS